MEAHAARAGGRLLLSGTVVDDVARPMTGARVALTVSPASGAAGGVDLSGAAPAACSEGASLPVVERSDTLVLTSDEAGRFCVRLSLPSDRYVARLESRGQGLVDAARLELPIDLARAPVALRFDPEPSVLSLDDDRITFEVVASTEDDGVTVAAAGLPLALSSEAGVALGAALTDASGRCRFDVDPARLGPPGRGELRVTFAGTAGAGAASRGADVERRTGVELTAPDATDLRLPAGSPDDGIPLRVLATARCARRGCIATPGGAVEVSAGGGVVGAAALERDGIAHLVATFATPATELLVLEVRYRPDAPWFQPHGELSLRVPVRAPSPWRKAPLVLAGLVALAWLVLARLRPGASSGRASRRVSRPISPQGAGEGARPGVTLVAAGRTDQGWQGRLRDAHDGQAIAGARVAIERRGFDQVSSVAQVWSDAGGTFVLAPLQALPGDELVAEGAQHAPLRGPVPGAGVLDIALVLRKRALLERLVHWARGRGAPFDARPEATPGHVRRAAGAQLAVARWADAVERAAYGGQPVDAAAQAAVERLAPGDAAPSVDAPPPPGHEPGPQDPLAHVDGARRRSL